MDSALDTWNTIVDWQFNEKISLNFDLEGENLILLGDMMAEVDQAQSSRR